MSDLTDVFGGQTVPPAEQAYAAYHITSDSYLIWPNNYGANIPDDGYGHLLAADILEVSNSSAGITLALPPANQQSVGKELLIRNTGANSLPIADNTWGSITTITPGEAKYFYITDNTTIAGTWSLFTYGTGTSGADAALLAGAGLQVSATNRLQSFTDYITVNGSYAVLLADRAKLIDMLAGSTTASLPIAAQAGLGYYVILRNSSAGGMTVTALLDGATIDNAPAKSMAPGESAIYVCNGVNWVTVGYGRSVTFAFSELILNAALPSITLTATDVSGRMLRVTGTATANIEVILPSVTNVYFTNVEDGMGTYTVNFKTSAGLGAATITLAANQSTVLYCDGTNVTTAMNFIQVSNLSLNDGSAAAPTLTFNLDTDTGIYRAGSGTLGVTSNGTATVNFNTTNITPVVDNQIDLGTTFNRFKNLYVAGTASFGGTTIPAGKTLVVTTDKLSALSATTSAELAGVISDETGTGSLVFANSPTLTGVPLAPTAAAGTNTTQLATTAYVFSERANTFTLTNKTISGAANTLTNIGNSSLVNSSITLGTSTVSLGSTLATIENLSSISATTFVGSLSGNATNVSGTVAVANGGTGATTSPQARLNLLPSYAGNAGKVLAVNPGETDVVFQTVAGTGTVTSVNASGGTTGLSFSGGPVTISGTLTLGGTLGFANGGTGQTAYSDGQLLIGRTDTGGLSKATLTQGTGISITNGTGAITVANSAPMVYPTAGVAVSTGSAWGSSLAAPSGALVGTTDAQALSNKTLTSPTINAGYTEQVYTITDGAAVDLNPINGSIQLWTLGASRSPTASSFTSGQSIILGVTAGANSITWPSVIWTKSGGGGTAPTLSGSGISWVVLWKVSTTLYGSYLGDA